MVTLRNPPPDILKIWWSDWIAGFAMNGTGGLKNLDWISHQPPVTRLCLWWSWALDLYCIASFVQCLSLQPTVPVQDFRRTLWNLLNMSRWCHQSWRWRCFTDWPAIRLVVCLHFFSSFRCILSHQTQESKYHLALLYPNFGPIFPSGERQLQSVMCCSTRLGWPSHFPAAWMSRWNRWTKWEP